MQDSELKKLLLETCPVCPGQEGRAWQAFREQLQGAPRASGWSYLPHWRAAAAGLVAVAAIFIVADYVATSEQHVALATVESQSPEVYATAFYSDSAQAQVVRLKGMDPATDKLTYLDPSTVLPSAADKTSSTGDPNSL